MAKCGGAQSTAARFTTRPPTAPPSDGWSHHSTARTASASRPTKRTLRGGDPPGPRLGLSDRRARYYHTDRRSGPLDPWTFARQSRGVLPSGLPGGRRQRKRVRRIDPKRDSGHLAGWFRRTLHRDAGSLSDQYLFWPFGAVPRVYHAIGLWPAGVDAVARRRKPSGVRRLVVRVAVPLAAEKHRR